jgi:hypothetical protein
MCGWFNKPWLDFVGRQMKHEVGNGWTEGVYLKVFQRCIDTYMAAFRAPTAFTMTYRLRRHAGVFRENPRQGCGLLSGGCIRRLLRHCMIFPTIAAVEAQLRREMLL